MTDASDGGANAADPRHAVLPVLMRCFRVQNWLDMYAVLRDDFPLIAAHGLSALDEMRTLGDSEAFASRSTARELAAHRNNLQTIRNIVAGSLERGLARTFARVDLEIAGPTDAALAALYDRASESSPPERIRLLRACLDAAADRTQALQAQLHFELGSVLAADGSAQSVEEAFAHLKFAASVYTAETDPRDWGETHYALADLYARRKNGERLQNLDNAIRHYHLALDFFRLARPLTIYARVAVEMAACCLSREYGDSREHIERAIQCCDAAVKLVTREEHPLTWGLAHGYLCECYVKAGQGPTRHDEIAAHVDAAGEVLTEQEHAAAWARVQHYGGRADIEQFYFGSRDPQVLERGIERLTGALRVITRQTDEEAWVEMQTFLGEAFKDRVAGDPADNIERSIAACEWALDATPDSQPHRRTALHNSLGVCFSRRLVNDGTSNLARARRHYQSALETTDKSTWPYGWAMTHMNLATLGWTPAMPTPGDDADLSIEHSELALQVFTREAYPYDWAALQTNLANFHLHRAEGARSDNIARAMSYAQAALEVRTRASYPVAWAQAHTLIGDALYRSAALSGDAGQSHEAATHLQAALEVYRPEQFPDECNRVAGLLGDMAFDRRDWQRAADAYETANKATDALYTAALFRRTRRGPIGHALKFHNRAYALAKLGRARDAVVLLENSRGRELRTIFADPDKVRLAATADPEALQLFQEAQQLDRTADAADRSIGIPQVFSLSGDEASAFVGGLNERALKTMHSTLLMVDDSARETYTAIFTAASREVEENVRATRESAARLRKTALERLRRLPNLERFAAESTFEDVTAAATVDCALVFLVATRHGSVAAIVRRDAANITSVDTEWLDDFSVTSATELLREWQQAQNEPDAFEGQLDRVLSRVGSSLIAPVVRALAAHGVRRAALLPAGYLSLLPLHAAKLDGERSGSFAGEVSLLGYAPSAHALRIARESRRSRTPKTPSLFAVGNPRPDDMPLPYAHQEVASVSRVFDVSRVVALFEEDASMDAVLNGAVDASHVHFACHCIVDWHEPLFSRLELSDVPLQLRDIFYTHARAWQSAAVVVVSACQSGAPDLTALDEAIGWPTAFLLAGVPTVIAAQWPVDDTSTALLMGRLYELMLGSDGEPEMDPVAALTAAQLWMRSVTLGELRARVATGTVDAAIVASIVSRADDERPECRPFEQSPFDWAAFATYGA